MVVGGLQIPNLVEIIDLESASSNCSFVTQFPIKLFGQMGYFGYQNSPLVCGGGNPQIKDCYVYKFGSWMLSPFSMTAPRQSSVITQSPFASNKSIILFMVGGQNGSGPLSSAEVLTNKGWESFQPSFPGTISVHCMLLINSTTVMVIGGRYNADYSIKTFYMSDSNRQWVPGPLLLVS